MFRSAIVALGALVGIAITPGRGFAQDTAKIAEARELICQERHTIFLAMHPTAQLTSLGYCGHGLTSSGFYVDYAFHFKGRILRDIGYSRMRFYFKGTGAFDSVQTYASTAKADPFWAAELAVAALKKVIMYETGLDANPLIQLAIREVKAKKLLELYLEYRNARLQRIADNPSDNELLRLINGSDSMSDKDRGDWIALLPRMRIEQRRKLRSILIEEREKLAEIDRKYEEELRRLGINEPIGASEVDIPTDDELIRLMKQSPAMSQASEKEKAEWIALLPKLSGTERRRLRDIFINEAGENAEKEKQVKQINAHLKHNEYAKAIALLDEAIKNEPNEIDLYFLRAQVHQACKNHHLAIADFSAVLKSAPRAAAACQKRAFSNNQLGNYPEALKDYERSVELAPESKESRNSLAWFLATCPDDSLRDGAKAVEHARKACELSDWKESVFFDTLAAACAESGEFQSAVEWQTKALADSELEQKVGKKEFANAKKRLSLFKQKKPWREPIASIETAALSESQSSPPATGPERPGHYPATPSERVCYLGAGVLGLMFFLGSVAIVLNRLENRRVRQCAKAP